jgi:hypothetical protein
MAQVDFPTQSPPNQHVMQEAFCHAVEDLDSSGQFIGMNGSVPRQQRAPFGYGGNDSFSLLEVAEVVTGGLRDEILRRQAATICVNAGTPPVVWSQAGKHPQVGFRSRQNCASDSCKSRES